MSTRHGAIVIKDNGAAEFTELRPSAMLPTSKPSLADQITEAEVELAKWTQRLKKLWDEEQAASNLRTPYDDGAEACVKRRSIYDNPHLPATIAWADWRSGWLDAKLHDRG